MYKVFNLPFQYNVSYTVGIRKNRKKSIKTHHMVYIRLKDISLRMHLFALLIRPYGDVLRTLGRLLWTLSGRNWDVSLPSM